MSKILVTGGSGSLGRHLIKELIRRGEENVVSLSRDEGLIKEAREFVDSPHAYFIIGDTRDPQTVKNALEGTDVVFHAAAMKDVVFAEAHPREAVKNNILGILNLLDQSDRVSRFINVSSDKAIGVVNCYGATKLLAEYLVSETNNFFNGDFLNVRCPNLLGSRGSVIDVWKNQAKMKGKIEITDPDMTRFFITIPDAASFIVDLGEKEISTEEILYPKSITRKFKLGDLAEAFVELNPGVKIEVTGKRPGEKVHEDYLPGEFFYASVEELKSALKDLI